MISDVAVDVGPSARGGEELVRGEVTRGGSVADLNVDKAQAGHYYRCSAMPPGIASVLKT